MPISRSTIADISTPTITWTGAPCVLAERPGAGGGLRLCSPDGLVTLPDDVAERDTLARPQQGDRYRLAPGPPDACSAPLGPKPAREWRLALPLIFRG